LLFEPVGYSWFGHRFLPAFECGDRVILVAIRLVDGASLRDLRLEALTPRLRSVKDLVRSLSRFLEHRLRLPTRFALQSLDDSI
jgi:hypothetical protein